MSTKSSKVSRLETIPESDEEKSVSMLTVINKRHAEKCARAKPGSLLSESEIKKRVQERTSLISEATALVDAIMWEWHKLLASGETIVAKAFYAFGNKNVPLTGMFAEMLPLVQRAYQLQARNSSCNVFDFIQASLQSKCLKLSIHNNKFVMQLSEPIENMLAMRV